MLRQRTLKSSVKATGVGLHTGAKVTITIRPAAADTGVVFRRLDMEGAPTIRANALAVTDTRLCSALVEGEIKVATVEHLMSALAGLGIDNVYVDLDGPEVPILDGSAGSFVFLLQSAGIEEQNLPKRFFRIERPIEVRDGDKWARFEAYEGFRLTFEIEFDHPAIERSGTRVVFDFAESSYQREIARARTFGFIEEVEMMRANGLALGGSLGNAVVVDEYRVLNEDGLRYGDEFAKHKLLDAIGDLYLVGHPIIGAFSAYKSGHELNNKLLRAVLADKRAYSMQVYEREEEAPRGLARLFGQPA